MEEVIKLLVVDDDEVDRMIIKRSLRSTQLNTVIQEVTKGNDALEALSHQQFDFIFIDFMLPDMNGLELLQKIRERNILTPVQIVTSQGDERIAVEAIKTGASDYLPKTLLTPEGISQSIRNAIKVYKIEQERLQTEIQLKRTQEQLESVISGAPIVLWSTDASGIFTMSRGKGLSLIGKEDHQSIGESIYEAYRNYPQILECVQEALSGRESKCMTNVQEIWFETLFLPIYGAGNKVTGVNGVSYDISERIKNEQELTRAKTAAVSMALVKEQFLANMSHEIRTPMNGIIGLAEVLAQTTLSNQQTQYLKAIQTSANNLMVIINDLLDFSKIEAGKISLEVIPFEIGPLMQQLLLILDIKAKEQNTTLKLSLDKKVPAFVMGDPFRLTQILNNLVGNAVKFTPQGSVEVSLKVLESSDLTCTIGFTVSDTGIGISQDKLESIFEKFTQGSSDTSRKFGGTGLGLPIAKELVEVQGGQLLASSELGKGSIFSFWLPYQHISGPPEKLGTEDELSETELLKLKQAHVLLAEDNKINQMLVEKVLSNHKINFMIAQNGKNALELLKTNDFDVILMDLQMPEMDGYAAMREIRQNLPATKRSIPIIALTAHASQKEINKSLAAGANAYLSKPFKPKKLLKQIAAFIPFKKEIDNTFSLGATLPSLDVDLSYLRAFANGNEEFMQDILQVFVEQTPDQVQELVGAISQQKWAVARTIAHKIKPSLDLVGIKSLKDLNMEIEQAALHKKNLENLPSLVREMVTLVSLAVEVLQREIEKLK